MGAWPKKWMRETARRIRMLEQLVQQLDRARQGDATLRQAYRHEIVRLKRKLNGR